MKNGEGTADELDLAVRRAEARVIEDDLALQRQVDALMVALKRDARQTLSWAVAAGGVAAVALLLHRLTRRKPAAR